MLQFDHASPVFSCLDFSWVEQTSPDWRMNSRFSCLMRWDFRTSGARFCACWIVKFKGVFTASEFTLSNDCYGNSVFTIFSACFMSFSLLFFAPGKVDPAAAWIRGWAVDEKLEKNLTKQD